jgi:hypothetical protein
MWVTCTCSCHVVKEAESHCVLDVRMMSRRPHDGECVGHIPSDHRRRRIDRTPERKIRCNH